MMQTRNFGDRSAAHVAEDDTSTRHVDVFTFRRHDVDNPFIADTDVGRQAAGEPVAQFSIRKAGILEKWRVLFVTSTASSAGQVPRIR
jgi:hypothetical protein